MKVSDFGTLTASESSFIKYMQSGPRGILDLTTKWPIFIAFQNSSIRSEIIRSAILNEIDDLPQNDEKIQVVGAEINGLLDLSGRTITREIYLKKVKLNSDIVIYRSLTRTIAIKDSYLTHGLNADGIEVNGDLFLTGTISKAMISLRGSKVSGVLECQNSILDAELSFAGDRMAVGGGAFFGGIITSGNIVLTGAKFGADLDFKGSKIGNFIGDKIEVLGDVYIDGTEANGHVRFTRSRILGNLSFLGSTIKGHLGCDLSTISGGWMWREGAEINGIIDLSSSNIGHICDERNCWPSEIILDRCTYGGFSGRSTPTDAASRISWLSRMNPRKYGHDFWPQPYEECARVLRESGDVEGARDILIHKEKLQRYARRRNLTEKLNKEPFSSLKAAIFLKREWLKFSDLIAGRIVSFGYNPFGTVIPILYLTFIGALIFLAADRYNAVKPNLPEIQNSPEWVECGFNKTANTDKARAFIGEAQINCYFRQPEAASAPNFRPLLYSINALLPFVSLETHTYWAPDDRSAIGIVALYYLWIHIFLGWGLTLLAVAGFSGIIKTDSLK